MGGCWGGRGRAPPSSTPASGTGSSTPKAKARLKNGGRPGARRTVAPPTRSARTSVPGGAARYMSTSASRSARSSRVTVRSSIEEVGEHPPPLVGEHGLGVELDALGRQPALPDRHHDAAATGADHEDG